ncbi:type VI secretion system protein TssA [Melittangium boletus]|uniref:ImpA N-terminal domain-containing protein n=1 Tax=Melittangium boletus DSM 14713 TaxID=1294270 RepID=A0A250IAK4_9BACT|nr:type VI secretion system protein TssA [Melittangium boletus]ATB28914.1 hypothetical protein MEBOL_002363 [Melittangium boletus DSM 14713]
MSPVSEELEPLLRPISPETPSGGNLRYEPIYDQIREARREDDASLPQGVWRTALKVANWERVAELCQQALSRETKDLQLAVWLTDAWLSQRGVPGLERGMALLTALVERFWDTLWPALDPEDPEARLSPVKWLDDRLPLTLARVPLVWPRTPETLTLGDWQQLLRREKQVLGQPEQAREPEAAPEEEEPLTRETFLAAASRLPAAALTTSGEQVTLALTAATRLEEALDGHLGRTSAALRRTRGVLEELRALLTQLGGARPAPSPAGRPGAASTAHPAPSLPDGVAGSLQSRAEAYRLLSLAADYLMSTEPHSPVPYLVKRAMAWGDMPLGQLLGELVPDSSGLASIHTLLGMKTPE